MILHSRLQYLHWSFSLSWYFLVALTNSKLTLLISSTSFSLVLLSFSFICYSTTNSGCWEAWPLLHFQWWDMVLKLKLWAQDEKVWNDPGIVTKHIEYLKRFDSKVSYRYPIFCEYGTYQLVFASPEYSWVLNIWIWICSIMYYNWKNHWLTV